MSDRWMSHVTHMNESCNTYRGGLTDAQRRMHIGSRSTLWGQHSFHNSSANSLSSMVYISLIHMHAHIIKNEAHGCMFVCMFVSVLVSACDECAHVAVYMHAKLDWIVSTPKTQTTYFSEHPLHHYYDDGLINFRAPRPCLSLHFSQHKRNTIHEGNEAGETRRLSAEVLSGRSRSGTSGSGPWSAGCSRGSSVVRLLTFRWCVLMEDRPLFVCALVTCAYVFMLSYVCMLI